MIDRPSFRAARLLREQAQTLFLTENLTVAEIATRLGVSKSSAHRLIAPVMTQEHKDAVRRKPRGPRKPKEAKLKSAPVSDRPLAPAPTKVKRIPELEVVIPFPEPPKPKRDPDADRIRTERLAERRRKQREWEDRYRSFSRTGWNRFG